MSFGKRKLCIHSFLQTGIMYSSWVTLSRRVSCDPCCSVGVKFVPPSLLWSEVWPLYQVMCGGLDLLHLSDCPAHAFICHSDKDFRRCVSLRCHQQKCSYMSHARARGVKSNIIPPKEKLSVQILYRCSPSANGEDRNENSVKCEGFEENCGVRVCEKFWWRQGVCFVDSQRLLITLWKWVQRCLNFDITLLRIWLSKLWVHQSTFPLQDISYEWQLLSIHVNFKVWESCLFQVSHVLK